MDVVLSVVGLGPALAAYRVFFTAKATHKRFSLKFTKATHLSRGKQTSLFSMLKLSEVTFETIPECFLQELLLASTEQWSQLQYWSLAASFLTVTLVVTEIEIAHLNWTLMRQLFPKGFAYVPVNGWRKWVMTALMPVFLGSFFVLSSFSLVLLAKLSATVAIAVLAVDCGVFICWKAYERELYSLTVRDAPLVGHIILAVMMWCAVRFTAVPACRLATAMGVHHYCRAIFFSLVTSTAAVVATLRSSDATVATRYIAEIYCIPAGCVAVLSSFALLWLMGREQRRTFWVHYTRRQQIRARWVGNFDDPSDPDAAHALFLRRERRLVLKYCHDLALAWLKEGATTFELTKPSWYKEAWIKRLPSELRAALVPDPSATERAAEQACESTAAADKQCVPQGDSLSGPLSV
jgi:hypothetical protein